MNDKLRGSATAYAHHAHRLRVKSSSTRLISSALRVARRVDANGTTYSAGHNPTSRSYLFLANYFSGTQEHVQINLGREGNGPGKVRGL